MTTQRIEITPKGLCQRDLIAGGSGTQVTTALIGENSLMRKGLQHILSGTPFVLAEEIPVAGSTLPCAGDEAPALFIIDANQDGGHVAAMARQVREAHPQARIVALADHFHARFVGLGLAAGLDGFCLTASGREVLIKSFELVMLGETVVPSTIVRSILARTVQSIPQLQDSTGKKISPSDLKDFRLSVREAEVLNCLRDGSPNKIIARKLDISEATIKVHVKAVLRKIGAANRTQAAMWAADHLPKKGEASLSA
jgi:two-component system nitrate/nitrite response regulator NarL